MKLLATFLLVGLLATSAACAQSLRIATYNINWGNRGDERLVDTITSAKADIVCLQETTAESEQYLKRRLAERYPEFHAVGHNGNYAAERFVIAARTKLRDVTFHPPGRGLFGFYTATFRFGESDVRIVSVHLMPVVVRPGGGLRDAHKALAATEEIHAAEIEAVAKQVNKDQPTIVVGDFNSMSTFKAPQRLVQLGLIDSFAAVTKDADTQPTWHWPTRPLPLALRIDYIFHTPHFQTTKSNILRRDGSDHFLVVSELKRSEASEGK